MSSFSSDPDHDRLAALRAPVEPARTQAKPPTRRPELLVAVVAVVVGLAILLVVTLSQRGSVQVTTATSTTLALTGNSRIPIGMVLVAFPVEPGYFPPSIRPGDRVRIVATPTPDGTGSVRVLNPVVTIEGIDTNASLDGSTIVSVVADEPVAAAVAASGPLHVFLVGERQ